MKFVQKGIIYWETFVRNTSSDLACAPGGNFGDTLPISAKIWGNITG